MKGQEWYLWNWRNPDILAETVHKFVILTVHKLRKENPFLMEEILYV